MTVLISDCRKIQAGKYFFAYYKHKVWLQLLYHDVTGNVEFENESDALYHYDEHDTQLYSIIGEITNASKTKDKFEFIINYPKDRNYVHFRQSHFPLYEHDSSEMEVVEGLELFHPLPWTTNKTFKGLAKSMYFSLGNCLPSLFDSDFKSANFVGCVGMMRCDTWYNHESIPGFFGATSEMSFWMRVDSFPQSLFPHCVQTYTLMHYLVFIMFLLS